MVSTVKEGRLEHGGISNIHLSDMIDMPRRTDCHLHENIEEDHQIVRRR